MSQNRKRKTVLFMVETVTLAHIMRSAKLAGMLDQNEFEIHFAAQEIPEFLLAPLSAYRLWKLKSSIPSKDFLKHLNDGTLPFTKKFIQTQVEEDLKILSAVRPDVVIGDFRQSLAISSQVSKIKYINLTNITWSPESQQETVLHEIPLTRILGETIGTKVFKLFKPIAYKYYSQAFNQVARSLGVKPFRSLLDVYTAGDQTLFLDPAELVPARTNLKHQCLGPVTTSTPPIPGLLDKIPRNKPWIVVSMGSSGDRTVIPKILSALSQVDAIVLVGGLSEKIDPQGNPNVYAFPYLPLETLMEHSALLICQGGSASGYIALQKGVPFLAIPSNLDQFQFSAAVSDLGACLTIRPSKLTLPRLREAIHLCLHDPALLEQARTLQKVIATYQVKERFLHHVRSAVHASENRSRGPTPSDYLVEAVRSVEPVALVAPEKRRFAPAAS